MFYSHSGDSATLTYLIELDLTKDFTTRNIFRRTPVLKAAEKGNQTCLDILLVIGTGITEEVWAKSL